MDDRMMIADNSLTKSTSAALSLIRWPLGVCIVMVHWFAFSSIATAGLVGDRAVYGTYMALCSFVEAFIADCSVGMFFFISGYLFFCGGGSATATYKSKLRRRVRTLLVPYLLWNLLMIVAAFIWESPLFYGVFPSSASTVSSMTAATFFRGFFGLGEYMIPHNGNLWFIRDLMIGILAVPLLLPVLRRRPYVLLAVFALGYIWFSYRTDVFLSGLFAVMFFFNWGASMSLRHIDLAVSFRPLFRLSLVLYAVCGTILLFVQHRWPGVASLVKTVEMVAAIVLVVNLAVSLVERYSVSPVRFLTAATFFMFAFHPLIYGRLQWYLALKFTPETDMELCAVYIAGFMILLAVIHIVFYLLRRFTPRFLSVLIGKRL